MSLINQVLNDLEKRGANARSEGVSIRVVQARKNLSGAAWLMAAMLVLAIVAAGLWWKNAEPKTRVVPAPAMPVAVPQAALQPAVVAAQETSAAETRRNDGEKIAGAATRLSFELSAIPLPSGLRSKADAVATAPNPNKAASSATRNTTQTLPKPSEGRVGGDGLPVTLTEVRNDLSAVKMDAASAAVAAGSVDKQIKQVTVQQQANNEFRKASGLMQQGRINEAIAGYEAALQFDAGHDDARQAMVGLLLENKHNADAERVLQDGLKHNPRHGGFAMLLARLQVERNELALALETLQKTLPYAEQQADYQAFTAALLQRQGRHHEAISHYQVALQLSPNSGVWLMGLGISLQAVQRNEEARGIFKRAIESRGLSAELQAFVEQRLKEL